MRGYKLLTAQGRSLSDQHGAVTYPLDGTWAEVPGNGAYVGLTLSGLLRGGFGPLLCEVEYKEPTGTVRDGAVITARRVRVVRHTAITIDNVVAAVIRSAWSTLKGNRRPWATRWRKWARDWLSSADRSATEAEGAALLLDLAVQEEEGNHDDADTV